MTSQTQFVAYTDGAAEPTNPGPSGGGYVVYGPDGRVLLDGMRRYGRGTNNVAEVRATLDALQDLATALGPATPTASVLLRTDSTFVEGMLTGRYRVSSPDHFAPLSAAIATMDRFQRVVVEHIPREVNARADALSKRAASDPSVLAGADPASVPAAYPGRHEGLRITGRIRSILDRILMTAKRKSARGRPLSVSDREILAQAPSVADDRIRGAAERLAQGGYEVELLRRSRSKGGRDIFIAVDVLDRAVLRHLAQELAVHLRRAGVRVSWDRGGLVRAAHRAILNGYHHYLKADIHAAYPSTPIAQAVEATRGLVPAVLFRQLRGLLSLQVRTRGDLTPIRFLPPGLAVSAALLAARMRGLGWCGAGTLALWFVDDVLLLDHTSAGRDAARRVLASSLGARGYSLSAAKTRAGHVRDGFEFLGAEFMNFTVQPDRQFVASCREALADPSSSPNRLQGLIGAAAQVSGRKARGLRRDLRHRLRDIGAVPVQQSPGPQNAGHGGNTPTRTAVREGFPEGGPVTEPPVSPGADCLGVVERHPRRHFAATTAVGEANSQVGAEETHHGTSRTLWDHQELTNPPRSSQTRGKGEIQDLSRGPSRDTGRRPARSNGDCDPYRQTRASGVAQGRGDGRAGAATPRPDSAHPPQGRRHRACSEVRNVVVFQMGVTSTELAAIESHFRLVAAAAGIPEDGLNALFRSVSVGRLLSDIAVHFRREAMRIVSLPTPDGGAGRKINATMTASMHRAQFIKFINDLARFSHDNVLNSWDWVFELSPREMGRVIHQMVLCSEKTRGLVDFTCLLSSPTLSLLYRAFDVARNEAHTTCEGRLLLHICSHFIATMQGDADQFLQNACAAIAHLHKKCLLVLPAVMLPKAISAIMEASHHRPFYVSRPVSDGGLSGEVRFPFLPKEMNIVDRAIQMATALFPGSDDARILDAISLHYLIGHFGKVVFHHLMGAVERLFDVGVIAAVPNRMIPPDIVNAAWQACGFPARATIGECPLSAEIWST